MAHTPAGQAAPTQTEIAPPPATGRGISLPQPAVAAPTGFVEEEYLIGGTATRFDPVDTPDDGFWSVTPGGEAEYRIRVVVRRPADPEHFSGTVVLEWFNVSAVEAAPDWVYLSEEIGRAGHAYVGVSAQRQGIEGGETLIDVEVDDETAARAGATAVDSSGLKHIDPERYGSLVHPGDAYAYDIFGQVGRAVRESPTALLGPLVPTQVIALGESQSAIFLSTLVNAVHPVRPTFDGFLIHSRAADAAPLDGRLPTGPDRHRQRGLHTGHGVRIRTDVSVPVLIFEAETDLTVLGYAHARQPDTDVVRTWEVAGTAHADAHVIRAIIGGPRDPGVGSLLGCPLPVNAGPHHEVVQAALHHLVRWAAGGVAPPAGGPLEMDGDAIARDANRIAIGGVRNPLVDVPTAAYIGDPPDGLTLEDIRVAGLPVLFGQTVAFDRAKLLEMYGSFETYLTRFKASAAEHVAAGFLLQPDADELVAEAEANRALFGLAGSARPVQCRLQSP